MTVIECKECEAVISNKARSCPNCGAETKYGKIQQKKEAKKERVKRASNIQGVGCLIIIASIVLGFTVIGLPFAIALFVIGTIVLLAGLFA